MTDIAEQIIEHYGVVGMKWGKRRARSSVKPSADAKRALDIKDKAKTAKSTKHLSNKQLQDAISRMQLEQQFSQVSKGIDKTRRQKTAKFIGQMLGMTAKQTVQTAVNTEMKNAVDKSLRTAHGRS